MTGQTDPRHRAALSEADARIADLRFREAREALYRALTFGPASARILSALAACSFECGLVDEMIAYSRAALTLSPDDPTISMQLGIACLLQGHDIPGWALYNQRKRIHPSPLPKPPPLPVWNGEPLNGAGIVVLREQGMGDVVQFVRFVPEIASRGGRVYLDVQAPLRRLFTSQPHLGTVLGTGEEARISTYAYFMDLPRIFEESPQGSPGASPYIHLSNTSPLPRPVQGERLRVGLAWAGKPTYKRDRLRSINLDLLRPLLEVPGCEFFSVMVGPPAQEIAKTGLGEHLHDLSGQIRDFLDLATVLASLDLIISVDTAVCHLVGALGRPVWTLLYSPPDWRWGLTGTTTAWYPTMRLFRQQTPQDWLPVIEEVRQELTRLCANQSE